MNTPIKLSVSSILLAGILTGCSQHQIKPLYSDDGLHGGATVSTGYAKRQIDPRVVYKWEKQVAILHADKIDAYKKMAMHEAPASKQITPISKKIKKHNSMAMPPAKAGQCYAKVKQPAVYKMVTKKIRIAKAAYRRIFVRGPQYKWISKKVLVRPASYTQRVIPAVYKTVKKRIIVKPSYFTWQKGKGKITRIDHATGEILCRVKIPAVYKNITHKVLVQKAKTIQIPNPALYKTIKHKKRVSPAQFKTVHTPARYKTKRYRVKTASAKYVWKEVICKKNVVKNHTAHHPVKKFYKAKQHKAKTYVKKYTPTQHVKKKVVRKASYSRKMLSAHKARPIKPRYLKKASYKKAVYTKKRVTPRKKRVSRTYRPATLKRTVYKPTIKKKVHKRPIVKKKVHKRLKVVAKPRHVNTKRKAKKVSKKVRLTKQNAILRIQTALRERGFNPGKVDGKLGPATVSALTAFQRKNGLATGKLNRATLRALRLI